MISSLDGGGSERQTVLLLQHLDRARFAPELYLLNRRGSLLAEVPDDVPIHAFDDQLPPPSAADATMGVASRLSSWLPGHVFRQQVDHCRATLRQRSIDVVYDRTFLMSLLAAAAARPLAIPRVATLVSPPSHAVPLHAGRFLAIKRRRLRQAYQTAAAVIAVSHHTANDAAAYHQLPGSRFQVIPNPVDAAELQRQLSLDPRTEASASSDRATAHNGSASPAVSRFTIVCVGRLSSEKGQDELIAAMPWLCQWMEASGRPRLWIVGDGPCRQALHQQVQDLQLTDCVEFVGHQPNAARWIAAADALCLPSHFEGFPNVMLEAMALGTPVVARSIPAITGLGRLAVAPDQRGRDSLWQFTTDPQHPAGWDLARKLLKLRSNSTATRSKLSAAQRLVCDTLAVDQIVGRLQAVLQQAAAGRPAGQLPPEPTARDI